MKRWGVIFLVLALVMSITSLAYADDGSDMPDADGDGMVEVMPGTYNFELESDFLSEMVNFVFYWGYEEDGLDGNGCPPPEEGATDTVGTESTEDVTPPTCLPLKKPNHGQFVSTMVHWIKANPDLFSDDAHPGKKVAPGKIVKGVAHDDFGKGPKEKKNK